MPHPRPALRSTWILWVVASTLLATADPPRAELRQDPMGAPAVQEVVAMLEAGLGEEVIVARVAQLSDVPELTGQILSALKDRGATDRVLLALIAASDRGVVRPAPAGPRGWLRVVVAPSFSVSQLGVSVDGTTVATQGVLPRGESEPGRMLPQPSRIELDQPLVVWEGETDPGAHLVQLGFGVARIEVDPNDIWLEYSRQSYTASGVLLPNEPARSGWQEGHAAICQVGPGERCQVVATFEKRAPTRFGGLPLYLVSYDVSVARVPADASHD